MMRQLGHFVLLASLMVAYYGVGLKRFGGLSRPLMARMRFGKNLSLNDLEKITRLALAGLSQLLFLLCLLVVTGVSLSLPSNVVQTAPRMVGYGALLGAGELALSAFLCQLAAQTLLFFDQRTKQAGMDGMLAASNGGWLREYRKVAEHLPLGASALIIALYVSVEELIFRSVALAYFRGGGNLWAVLASTTLFAGVQAFNMPSLRAALFPVLGAALLGLLHGCLMLAVPNILPLIVAHLVFFTLAIQQD